MAQVTVGYSQRPEQIAWQNYQDGGAAFVRAIIYANPTLTLDDIVFLPNGTEIEVPDPIPREYSERAAVADPELARLFAVLNGTAKVEAAASRYTGYRNIP